MICWFCKHKVRANLQQHNFGHIKDDVVERCLQRDMEAWRLQCLEDEDALESAADAHGGRFRWQSLQEAASARATVRARSSKYGLCPRHNVARKPWIFGTGKRAGLPVKICGLWFQKDEATGARLCWHSERASQEEIQTWPKYWRELHASLWARIQRGGRD